MVKVYKRIMQWKAILIIYGWLLQCLYAVNGRDIITLQILLQYLFQRLRVLWVYGFPEVRS